MNISCCICSELFVPSDDVHFTPCGHFFHLPCVCHWLERSKTCPHCRAKVTRREIHRAYFTLTNTDSIESDATVLTSRIDSLNFQILLKDKDLQICGADNEKLKQQAAGLRAEVRKLEADIDKHRSVNHAYKEQLKYFKEQNSDAEAAKKEVVRLMKKVQEFRNVETLISGSQDDIDRMLSKSQDVTSLVTFISVMKREMDANVQRRKELRTKIRTLERDIMGIKAERDRLTQQAAKCGQLEEDLAHSENENQSLRIKLRELERQLSSKKQVQSEDIQRFIAESPAPERLKTLRHDETISISSNSVTMSPEIFSSPESNRKEKSPDRFSESKQDENSPKHSPKLKSREKSPYLSIKPQGAWGYSTLSQQTSRPTKSCGSSLRILSKKPRISASKSEEENNEMHYDGFGGHSKVDNYPSPILRFKPKVLKNNLMSVKVKRRKLATDGSSNKLDNFFVDLT